MQRTVIIKRSHSTNSIMEEFGNGRRIWKRHTAGGSHSTGLAGWTGHWCE